MAESKTNQCTICIKQRAASLTHSLQAKPSFSDQPIDRSQDVRADDAMPADMALHVRIKWKARSGSIGRAEAEEAEEGREHQADALLCVSDGRRGDTDKWPT